MEDWWRKRERREWERYGSGWYEQYLENPMDLMLRQRHESMYGVDIYGRKPWWDEYRERKKRELIEQSFRSRAAGAQLSTATAIATAAASMASAISSSFSDIVAAAYGIAEQRASAYGIIPPWRLPSMAKVIIKNIINVGLIAMFAVLGLLGNVNHPFLVAAIMALLAVFLRSLPMIITTVALLIFGSQATTEALSWLGAMLAPSTYANIVAGIYAKAFLYTLPITVISSAVSIVWNRRRNREMRRRWRELVSEVMEELLDKYRRQGNESDTGERKEVTVADFFNVPEPKEGAESSDKEKEYDLPNLNTFFSLEDKSRQ